MSNPAQRTKPFKPSTRSTGAWLQGCLIIIGLLILSNTAHALGGATVQWSTYEAEDLVTTGTLLGPEYGPNSAVSEASGRKCVSLREAGQYLEFSAQSSANALVIRYSVPDSADGVGADTTISVYQNSVLLGKLPLTSKYSWLYGSYPFTNDPTAGTPRNFYDETRTNGLSIRAGDVIRLQRDVDNTAAYCLVDLVDLENVAAPLSQPSNSLSILNYGAGGAGVTDDTAALLACITAARSQGKSVWLPVGNYKITSTVNLPSNLTIQGAGMWYTSLVGDALVYSSASHRVSLIGKGGNIHLSDFAIVGKLNYRNDQEPNDGLGGSYGSGSTLTRLWVEHTKTGAWIVNSAGLVVDGCRFRDTIADGINLCVGTKGCLVTNCTTRGTGDDCFAIWPAAYTQQTYTPGSNVIQHCTGQLPFLANGAAIYGASGNRIEDCLFTDTTYGCGILFSTTFPVGTNVFSGLTSAQRTDIVRCGGYDPGYQWRAAVQLCLDKNNPMTGLNLVDLNITNSVSDGLSIIGASGVLSNSLAANVNIPDYGLGASGRNGVWVRSDAAGSLTLSNCTIVQSRNDSTNFSLLQVFAKTNGLPRAQRILDFRRNQNLSVTLAYATIAGFQYEVEAVTNLWLSSWATVPGSVTNATSDVVSFTAPSGLSSDQCFYRVVSP